MGLNRFHSLLLIAIFSASPIFADWSGPSVILSLSWGQGETQVGFVRGDTITYDMFPMGFSVSPSMRIAIYDWENKRLAVISPQGQLQFEIKKLVGGMFSQAEIFYTDAPFGKYDSSGNPIWNKGKGYNWLDIDGEGNIYGFDTHSGPSLKTEKYSPAGELLGTFTERPLDLGRVSTIPLGEGKYQQEIMYPNRTYTFVSIASFIRFSRNGDDSLSVFDGDKVLRVSTESEIIDTLTLPTNEYETLREGGGGFEAKYRVISEYGEPVFDLNGHVYTWMRSDTHYKILKWTWADTTDAPPPPEPAKETTEALPEESEKAKPAEKPLKKK